MRLSGELAIAPIERGDLGREGGRGTRVVDHVVGAREARGDASAASP